MINLKNDYCGIAHPEIINKINSYSEKTFVGYGLDEISLNADRLIKKCLQYDKCDIHYLLGGTITNKILLAHILKPFEAVICVDSGHINVHETGAIEETGHKVITVPNKNGKITVEEIKKVILSHTDEHMVKPKVVYISNSTEFGTIYKYKEIKEISEYCKKNNLYLYMDGARLGAALTSNINDVKITDLPNLVDAFYIGGTKNGLMFGEALVLINNEIKNNFRYSLKHYGGMYSKGFITGIQFEALFENNLFFMIAEKENEMAQILYNKLTKVGVKFLNAPETNQIFCIFDNNEVEKLKEKVLFEVWEKNSKNTTIRLVTSYMTTLEDIDKMISIVKEIKGNTND